MINDEYCWMHTDLIGGGNWTCSACNLIAFFEALSQIAMQIAMQRGMIAA